MAGELSLVTQKSSGHGTRAPLDRFDLACWGSYQKTQEGQRGWTELLPRVLSKHIPTVFTFFFFLIMYDNSIFFSLLWAVTTQFQLFDHLAKGTPNKNSIDIDSPLILIYCSKRLQRSKSVLTMCPLLCFINVLFSWTLLNKLDMFTAHIFTPS